MRINFPIEESFHQEKENQQNSPQLFYLTNEWENLNDSFYLNCFFAFFSPSQEGNKHEAVEENYCSLEKKRVERG